MSGTNTTETNETNETPKTDTDPKQPFAVFPDSQSFQSRLDREVRKTIKELGVENVDALKSKLAQAEELQKKQAEAERASMSEQERLRADLAARDAAIAAAKAEADLLREQNARIQFEAQASSAFAQRGIKNTEFAMFKIEKARATAGGSFDLAAEVEKLAADEAHRAALGIAAPPKETTNGVSTTPDNSAPPKPSSTQAPGGKNAKDMTADEWAAHKRSLGL